MKPKSKRKKLIAKKPTTQKAGSIITRELKRKHTLPVPEGKAHKLWNNTEEFFLKKILRHIGASPEQIEILAHRDWVALSGWVKMRLKKLSRKEKLWAEVEALCVEEKAA